MRKPMIFCFKYGGKRFIAVKKFGAIWLVNKHKSKIAFDNAYQKLAIIFQLNSQFFNISDLI